MTQENHNERLFEEYLYTKSEIITTFEDILGYAIKT